jgi:hypothetical protein
MGRAANEKTAVPTRPNPIPLIKTQALGAVKTARMPLKNTPPAAAARLAAGGVPGV